MAYRGKDLAGTCGKPRHDERVYVDVKMERSLGSPISRPVLITWPDGRSWRVAGGRPVAEYGREAFGNLVTRWEVTIKSRIKTLWHDKNGWFVKPRTI